MRHRLLISIVLLLLITGGVLAAPAQVRITISGMHCGGCATGIRAMLERTDGVLKADVSYEERRALVEYDASKTSPERIVAAIEKMGYKAQVKK